MEKQGKTGRHFKIADMYDEKRTNTGQDDSQIARVNNVDAASAGSCGRRERVVIDVATRIDAIDVTSPSRRKDSEAEDPDVAKTPSGDG